MNNQFLVDKRTQLGLTQEKVAELAGIERSYYTKIENGTLPSVKVAKRIAGVLRFEWPLFFESNGAKNAQKHESEKDTA
ncbi:helix-turn-helix transcriptional regulator [Paenibacillus macerans]|uniref:helix-turn-helix domain-containing protein n=1 Tax=Paenibacillus macerans TaxID=44252 RepID=UPI00203AE09B|nr:helix-turn-helix transcriptional regulator [Paenibacillus macerans]MCM3699247.1 helix-turn-helix transcriptional regulator [Paenibacillus macerans]